MSPWLFVLAALAAFRVFRLVARDTITRAIRDWLTERLGDTFADFITCPWCAGMWISAGTYAVARLAPLEVVEPVLIVLSISAVVGLIGENWDDA